MNLNRLQHNSHVRNPSRVSGNSGRRLVAIWLAAALLSLPFTPSLKAAEATAMKPCGGITTRGVSRVDGAAVISGETIFSGSHIITEKDATAVVSLGRRGRLELLPDSDIRLNFDEARVSASLSSGGVSVSLPAGIPGTVTTGEATVIADGGGEPVLFLVTIKDGTTIVTAQAGQVELRAFGRTEHIAAGQSASASRDRLSLDSSEQQTRGAQNLSGEKKTGIFLIGAAVAVMLIVLVRDNNKNQPPPDFGGCVTILSPTGSPTQCS